MQQIAWFDKDISDFAVPRGGGGAGGGGYSDIFMHTSARVIFFG